MLLNVATVLLGPLVGPECRRALGRGWLIVLRALAGGVLAGVVLIGVWYWWINTSYIDGLFSPHGTLRTAISIAEGLSITFALVMGPAVLAGSLAGERERGALGLLLTTRVTAREIVLGRLIGKLTQVVMVLLAGTPAVLFLGMLAGFNPGAQAMLFLLPLAVAFGGSGLAVAASIFSRRGRDALLAVYIGDIVFLLSPLTSLTGLPPELSEWVGALNPYLCLSDLAWSEDLRSSLVSIGLWSLFGLLGTVLAAFRLRPSCLKLGGKVYSQIGAKRRGWVPELDERPMMWKELYIERAGSLGRIGGWLGRVFITLTAGISGVLAGIFVWNVFLYPNPTREAWAITASKNWVGNPSMFISWLILWAVGLRAAVVISSERERGTWDAILTSPLDGREIVRGKLYGSLYALRWMIAAAFVSWTLACACGGMSIKDYAEIVIETAVIAAFMAAVGVRASLSVSTATRAMSWTIGIWLASWLIVKIVAAIILGVIMLAIVLFWMGAMQTGMTTVVAPPIPSWIGPVAWPVTTNLLYLLATVLIISDTRIRFDRIAGRMTEGRMAVAVDRLIFGDPIAPVYVGEVIGMEKDLADHPEAVGSVVVKDRHNREELAENF